MPAVQMSPEQFQIFIETVRSLAPPIDNNNNSKGSFANFNIRFRGQCDPEEFITAVETYKEVEGISDKDALKGITLLLQGTAQTWWKGVRREAKTWDDALRLIREHFSPTIPSYQVYLEIFEEKQDDRTALDTFVCQKRALFAKLPEGRHDEETELDFIYGLLNLKYRQHIPRYDIKTFKDLLEKGRALERHKR